MDAGNLLKPMLARGELHCIGATTLNEYRQYIEKDQALERRFQPVMVDEPTVEDTISILRGLKERYEVYHGVKISDSSLIAAATLSHRYITDRFLPDKAIDLVDEACAMIKTEMESMPTELDEISRKIMQLEIEETALSKEKDEVSKKRLADIQKEKAELKTKFEGMKAKWENEKQAIGKVQKLREEIERVNAEIEKSERNYELNKAAELKYGKLPELQKELEKEEKIAEKSKEDGLLRNKVTEDEIAAMNEIFPQFELQKVDDPTSRWHNCLAWVGTLRPGILEDTAWEVMAIYHPNHPIAQMGGSVCVYLIDPSLDDVTAALGKRPFHLINDGEGGRYLCTARRGDISDGSNYGDHVTSAVNTLTWACKWLMAVELVCTGDMTMEEFDAE